LPGLSRQSPGPSRDPRVKPAGDKNQMRFQAIRPCSRLSRTCPQTSPNTGCEPRSRMRHSGAASVESATIQAQFVGGPLHVRRAPSARREAGMTMLRKAAVFGAALLLGATIAAAAQAQYQAYPANQASPPSSWTYDPYTSRSAPCTQCYNQPNTSPSSWDCDDPVGICRSSHGHTGSGQ
jgi:hypothetical protein